MDATLHAYLRGAWNEIPSQRMIRASIEKSRNAPRKLAATLNPAVPIPKPAIEITDGQSLVGGGSTPAQSLPTKLLRIRSSRYSAADLETRLRQGPTGIPVIARIEDDRLLLDLRTVFPQQDSTLANAVAAALM